ncbi:MAG: hypothetical protein GY786_18490 [Proteobacteria bacterium]|nr:hypothetical protein [Pseudomonadota bacterium]
MKNNKKVVDLIYLEDKKSDTELKADYNARIQTWLNWLEAKLDNERNIEDSFIEEQTEYFMISNLLKNFIKSRLDWILDTVEDPDLRNKYLMALPPFSQMGKLKSFLLHFFQMEEEEDANRSLNFKFLNRSERELRILWDAYKMSRTMDSIKVMQNSLNSDDPFVCRFDRKHVEETLESMLGVLSLLLKICVKSEYHRTILTKFPLNILDADQILIRRENDEYLINDIVLEKFDYRNYIFFIYFRNNIKAQYEDQNHVFNYNYLDYEIIRQEFLIHWLHKRLKRNTAKNQIYENYKLGARTFQEIITEDPKREITLLKQLPGSVFNDLIAQVNDVVGEEFKAPVDPMSEKFGSFASQFLSFEKVKELAKKSVQAFKDYLLEKSQVSKKQPEFQKVNLEELETKEIEHEYEIAELEKKDIPYPYFVTSTANFKRQFNLFQSKMGGNKGGSFNMNVGAYLQKLDESDLIKRRTPRHEWTRPFLIKEQVEGKTIDHLLILGAEVRSKQLGMGYHSDSGDSHDLKSYFIYGSKQLRPELGKSVEERMVKGNSFYIYNFNHPQVIEKVMEFVEIILADS